MLKTIIFDAYGTLFDTGTGSVDAAAAILRKCGRNDILPKQFYARWKQIHRMHLNAPGEFVTEHNIYHKDLKCLYEEYGISSDADSDVEIMLAVQGTRIAFPETKIVIDELRAKYKLCTGSTTDTAPLLTDIERAGLCFDRIFTSESLEVYKPFPEFYEKILNELCISPSEVLFVGDSLLDDVYGPRQAGIRTCWINRKAEKAGEHSPDFELPDLRGLVEIAETL